MDWKDIRYKLLRIFLPPVALSVLLLVCYSALNWFVFAKADLLDEDVVDAWLPLTIAGFAAFIVVVPRIRVLALDKRGRFSFLFNSAAFALIVVPALVSQAYIRVASGDTTHVKNAQMIGTLPATKYYSADTTCLDPASAGGKGFIHVSGKQNQNLDFSIYAVVPLCAPSTYVPATPSILPPAPGTPSVLPPQSKPAPGNPPVWIGLKFFKTVDNSLSEPDRKKAYEEFATQSVQKINAENPAAYRYFTRLGKTSDRRNYDQALTQRGVASPASRIILIPHTDPFDQRTGDLLTWTFASLGIGMLIWLVMVLMAPLDQDKLEAERQGKTGKDDLVGLLIPKPSSYGLPILIDLNIAVFLVMVFAGLGVIAFGTEDLIAWGGNYGPALQGLGFFRLFSSQFVHGGLMHLANNMYGLLIAGLFLAPALNNWRLILCYLVAGLGGSIASAMLHPDIVSVGASGAIMGLWGILLALVVLKDDRVAQENKMVLINGAAFVGLTFLIGSMTPGIDNAAHVGGFLTGAMLGVAIYLLNRYRLSRDPAV